MGCLSSKETTIKEPTFTEEVVTVAAGKVVREKPTTNYKKPVWKSDEPLTKEQLKRMRDEFWDTQPHYGGSREIWDALKGVCDMEDMETIKLILETAGIVVAAHDMTICYDERGAKYELPKFVLCDPVNLA